MDKLLQIATNNSNTSLYKQLCNEEIEYLKKQIGIKHKIQFFEMHNCIKYCRSNEDIGDPYFTYLIKKTL